MYSQFCSGNVEVMAKCTVGGRTGLLRGRRWSGLEVVTVVTGCRGKVTRATITVVTMDTGREVSVEQRTMETGSELLRFPRRDGDGDNSPLGTL